MRVAVILLAAAGLGLVAGAGLTWVERPAPPAPPVVKGKGPKFVLATPPADRADAHGDWNRPAAPRRPAAAAPAAVAEAAEADDSGVYYPGCRAVRAAGKAPLYRGQPGYRSGMDGDGDGIACEPPPPGA